MTQRFSLGTRVLFDRQEHTVVGRSFVPPANPYINKVGEDVYDLVDPRGAVILAVPQSKITMEVVK